MASVLYSWQQLIDFPRHFAEEKSSEKAKTIKIRIGLLSPPNGHQMSRVRFTMDCFLSHSLPPNEKVSPTNRKRIRRIFATREKKLEKNRIRLKKRRSQFAKTVDSPFSSPVNRECCCQKMAKTSQRFPHRSRCQFG